MRNDDGIEVEGTKYCGMVAMDRLPEWENWWLWPERIALGSLTVLAGRPDVGKSRLAWELAARVSRGDAWPDGEKNPLGQGSVLIVTSENHLQISAGPALKAAGANMAKVVCAGRVQEKEQGRKSRRTVNLKLDLDVLEQMIVALKDCRMLIIDSISAYLGSGGGEKTAAFLRELLDLAARYQLAVVGVTHLRKGTGEAIDRVVGGLALTAAARSIWAVVDAGVGGQGSGIRSQGSGVSGDGARWFLPVKNNLSAERTGLGFEFVNEEGQKAPRVEWSADVVEATADEALAAVRASLKEQPKAVQGAMEFLRVALADGPRLVRELEAEARERGISQITLRRARVALEVRKFHQVVPGPWWVGMEGEQESGARNQESEGADHVDHVGEIARELKERAEDHVGEVSGEVDGQAVGQPPHPRPFSPGVPGAKGAEIGVLVKIEGASADHVDHVGKIAGDLIETPVDHVAEEAGYLGESAVDHVDHVGEIAEWEEELDEDDAEEQAIIREMLSASEWSKMPEDVLLRDLFGEDRHETRGFAEMSIFGSDEGAWSGRRKGKKKRRAK